MIEKIEKTIGGLKFAVVLLLIFAVAMVIGTFVESYNGTDYANRLIYKSPFFMGLQFLLFLSIFYAALLRLPPKKRLYGFYTIHSGLLLIGAGSYVTYHAGVDGQLTLRPKTPNKYLVIDKDILTITFDKSDKEVTYQLPYTPFAKDLDASFNLGRGKDLTLKKYYPYSENKFHWKEGESQSSQVHSSKYLFKNAFAKQEFTLSLHPKAFDFDASFSMGPLNVHYLPAPMKKCFVSPGKSKILLWNSDLNQCQTFESKNIELKLTPSDNRFFAFVEDNQVYSFFPDFSPWPMDQNLKPIANSKYRVLSLGLFEKKPNLFLFGRSASYFEDDKWHLEEFGDSQIVELPWMSATIKLLEHKEKSIPTLIPEFTKPIQESGEVLVGKQKAVSLEIDGKHYWVKSGKPLALLVDGQKLTINLGPKVHKLPFELSLDRFKMEKDPGTNKPASFESFVDLFTTEGHTKNHVYMNNPLKHAGFTFYQASYFPISQDIFGSVLSVNVDPGRTLKYLGSLLLVFGSIWHFVLNRKKYKRG